MYSFSALSVLKGVVGVSCWRGDAQKDGFEDGKMSSGKGSVCMRSAIF